MRKNRPRVHLLRPRTGGQEAVCGQPPAIPGINRVDLTRYAESVTCARCQKYLPARKRAR